MSKKINLALKAAAIAFTLSSVGAQAATPYLNRTSELPVMSVFELPAPGSAEALQRDKHPSPTTRMIPSSSREAPRVGTTEALWRAKFPWLYKAN